ncbi:MAG: hypothetical protein ACRCYU_18670 [Nocardioides sp.]
MNYPLNEGIDEGIAREIRESYRQLRRVEIIDTALHHHPQGPLVRRALRARLHRKRHRAAADRLDRALLALETQLGRASPGHHPKDFIDACRAILQHTGESPDCALRAPQLRALRLRF